MKQVWKFTLKPGRNTVQMPLWAVVLNAQFQPALEELQLWALVQPKEPTILRDFFVAMTGQDLPDNNLKYISTALAPDGFHVVHIFEIVA